MSPLYNMSKWVQKGQVGLPEYRLRTCPSSRSRVTVTVTVTVTVFLYYLSSPGLSRTLTSLLIIPLHPRPLMGQATRHTGMVPIQALSFYVLAVPSAWLGVLARAAPSSAPHFMYILELVMMFLGLRASRSLAPRALAAPRRAAPALRARSLAVTMSSEASAGAKMQGTVKWFNTVKGYGFITPEAGGGGDVFVHQTQIYARGFRSLAEGEEVEYEVELDESGRQRAISVTGPEGDYVQGAPRPPRADDYDAKYDETY